MAAYLNRRGKLAKKIARNLQSKTVITLARLKVQKRLSLFCSREFSLWREMRNLDLYRRKTRSCAYRTALSSCSLM